MIRRPPRSTLLSLHDALPISQFVNKVLVRGKRSTAERIVYGAMDIIKDKTGADPVATLKRAMDNVKPQLEVKRDRKSTRLNSSHANISYAVFCLKKKILSFTR